MRREPRNYLWDVREAADAILTFIADADYESYAESSLIHSAVERKFEIIGEALNLLFKTDSALARRIPEIERIIAFRNVLIHGYAVVEHARVWDIAQVYLPRLLTAVEELLAEMEK